jgi:hypothetical protein
MELDPVPAWLCQIETLDSNLGWQSECTFVRSTIESAIAKAASIILNDIWANNQNITNDSIVSQLTPSTVSSSYQTLISNTNVFFTQIRVSFTQTTV